jgi:hypothetical protein
MQEEEVGDSVVGMKDGRGVVGGGGGGGGGPVLPTTLQANTGLKVGSAVGENVRGSVVAEFGLSVGDFVG